ncbi:hypothetical protein [Legionella tunisiensis]|uniref:hypothetical protein n=1 Tax=Legionella tunisiensis TaxID=1034944 RepID=UPI00035E5F84|nr:hypothetical protein [Legionella tunisiensis]
MEQIRDELRRRVLFALNSPASKLYWFTLASTPDDCQSEADKVMHALNTFLSTRPAFVHIEEPQVFFANHKFVQIDISVDQDYEPYRHRHYHCYCASDDFLFNWFLYRSLLRPQVIVIDNSSSRNHGHSSKDDKKNNGDIIAFLFLAALAALLLVLAIAALYYMLGQALNSISRIQYNEGWLQGMVTVAGTLAAGYVSCFLSMAFATSPLMNLALLAGISSPVGVVALSLTCLTIIGAGAGCFITDKLQNYILRKTHPDALDPNDPNRFTLTAEEELNLLQKGFDLMRVKYAIFTLRSELGEEGVPTLLHRRTFGTNGKKVQENLEIIRKIRAGDMGSESLLDGPVTVPLRQGEATIQFDLRPLPYYQAPVYAMYPPPYYNTEPSAPLFE